MTGAILFGKLPAHGDFVSRGLAPADRGALDQWLTASLADARAALGEAFEDRYDHASPWRFAWDDPAGWVAGAMAPSVDAVGRRFPLLVARGDLAGAQVEPVAELAEGLIYDALGEGWDADRLCAGVEAASPERMDSWQGGEGWWTLAADAGNDGHLVGARPAGLLRAMLMKGRERA